MERYGYLLLEESSEDFFKHVHKNLYTNLVSCVTSAGTQKIGKNERVIYFKILKNADIVKMLHAEDDTYGFGFCLLKRSSINEAFEITDSSDKLYTHVMHCITSAKTMYFDSEDCFNINVKIGYFKVLNDDEVVKNLHIPCVK